MPRLLPDFAAILAALDAHQVRFVLIGGLAMQAQGSDCRTNDFDEVWVRATPIELYGVPVLVASLDDLIAMKQAAGRPKDQALLLELRALRRLSDEGTGKV